MVHDLLRPVLGRIRLACVLSALGALAGLAPFAGLVELADALLATPIDRGRAATVVVLIVLGLLLRAGFMSAALTITHIADVHLQAVLRRRMITNLGRVPLGWFSRNSSGRLRKTAMSDVDALHQLVAHHAVETTAAIVTPLGALAYLVILDWRLAVLAVATIPLYVAAYAWMERGSNDVLRKLDDSNARLSSAVVEFISGIAVVKTFGRAGKAHAAYRQAASEYTDFFAAWVQPMSRIEALAGLLVSAPVVGLVTAAGGVWFVGAGWVSPGEALAGVLLACVIPVAIEPLGFGALTRRSAGAAAARIRELLDEPPLTAPAVPRSPDGHRVDYDDVRFAYEGGQDVLHGVSFTCEPGTVTALVGPSGSGKSTLATLLPRFHDVTGGSIRIGGVDVRHVDPASLYRHVGFVLQDVQLVRGSIRDNVALGRPDATDTEIQDACRAAQIHTRITALPGGYDAVAGQDVQLSGGEAQRISIARALLADTPILVLDEATAFADAESEAAIQDALSRLAIGRTVLVIAHRLTTITDADRIVVLDHGRVTETGTHTELLAAQGHYARMWSSMTTGSYA
ncbi:ABC transporter ATP-binding protein [Kibdelosporangium phytohabitans]|uniref:ABC transporter n=1 Tax=Kibdelosporangium phytohabitans TaxID=860235 RepID=A0A0N9I989_9PSEU|nr:ABC transporter ATP-binding protein [Kibdelosporangium phytohabitans]ALG14981.1 ABC transporter [Kibdelosporangium phytohabitans]MBE1469394.1 ATP-binding cassette subfamily B protein [Kibdelosporangium phytohabitans]